MDTPESRIFQPINVDDDLRLEPFAMKHSEAIFEIVDTNRERLSEWLEWAPLTKSLEDVQAFAADAVERQQQPGGSCEWVVFVDGTPCGVVGCTALEWQDKRTSVGAWLGKGVEGRGVAHRALNAIIDQLFANSIHRIEAFHAMGNERSDHMLKSLGFTEEGVLRDHEVLHGKPVDDVVFSLLSTDEREDRRR